MTHLAVHDTLTPSLGTPNRLSAGYRVVMDVTDNSIDPTTLWVRDGRLCTGLDLKSATPFEAADYFLFYIEKVDRRQPPFSTPVTEAWDVAMKMAVQPSQQELDFAVKCWHPSCAAERSPRSSALKCRRDACGAERLPKCLSDARKSSPL